MRSTFKEKNLLLGKQILSFKSRPQLRKEANNKMTELLPLNFYLFTIISVISALSMLLNMLYHIPTKGMFYQGFFLGRSCAV